MVQRPRAPRMTLASRRRSPAYESPASAPPSGSRTASFKPRSWSRGSRLALDSCGSEKMVRDPQAPDLGIQLLHVAGGGFAARGGLEDGGDLQAVGGGEIAPAVMEDDHLVVLQRGQLFPDLPVHGRQFAGVGAVIPVVESGPGGVGRGQRRGDIPGHDHAVGRAQPVMGIEFAVPGSRGVVVAVFPGWPQGDALEQGNDDGARQALGDAVDPVVDAADLEDDPGGLEFPELAGGEVEGVGRSAGGEDLDDARARAGDVAGDVGRREDGRRQHQGLRRRFRRQSAGKQKPCRQQPDRH